MEQLSYSFTSGIEIDSYGIGSYIPESEALTINYKKSTLIIPGYKKTIYWYGNIKECAYGLFLVTKPYLKNKQIYKFQSIEVSVDGMKYNLSESPPYPYEDCDGLKFKIEIDKIITSFNRILHSKCMT